MRRLTVREVMEQFGGKLPPDAVLRPDDDEVPPSPPPPPRTPRAGGRGAKRGRRGDRFGVFNGFADYSMAELTGAETKVWILLFRDTKAEAGLARTGQADLARRAGLSVRGVQKTIAKLVRRGLLRIIRRGRLNAGPTVYRVFATGGESTPA